jgi:hypothetical protein
MKNSSSFKSKFKKAPVLYMNGRQLGKTTKFIARAIEREQDVTDTDPITLLAGDEERKRELRAQLQCMLGLKPTRIRVMTYEEFRTENASKPLESSDGPVQET